jgi:cytochrome c-type biogenesis protein CcmF
VVFGVGVPLAVAALEPERWIGVGAAAAVAIGLWVVGAIVLDAWRRLGRGGGAPTAWWGMQIAHFGFAMALVGVALTHALSIEKDLRMAPGETTEQRGIVFEFRGVTDTRGPNYVAQTGLFAVTEGGRTLLLSPEKRRYLAAESVMTEAAIDPGFLRDVYVSLGEPLEDQAWAVRIHVKPFVRWVWFGAIMMALGGALAVTDPRYRRLARRAARAQVEGAPA